MILITGATGSNGSVAIKHLVATGVPVRGLVRDMEKARGIADLKGAELVVGDMLRPETLIDALKGVDLAFLNSSAEPRMAEVQSNFIAAAKAAGVRHVVKLSGVIADLDSGFRFARMHREIEIKLENSGMIYTHLRCGEFMSSYFRQLPSILGKSAIFIPMANERIASVDTFDIGEIAANILRNPKSHERKAYEITGAEANSMDEIAAALSQVTGKTIRYVDVSPEDAKKAQLAAGMPQYLVDAVAELFSERRKGKESKVFPAAKELLGRRPTTFKEFTERHAEIFRGTKSLS